ncbi:MAG: head GIN domain-containing protein [Flavipsychrobacter sp.]
MKKVAVLLALAISTISFTSCRKHVLRGGGSIVTETRSLADFDEIISNGSIDVEVLPSNRDEVRITGYQNLVSAFKTDVSNKRLYLEYDDQYINIKQDNIKLTVYTTDMTVFTLNGSGDVAIPQGANTTYMELKVTGSGNIRMNGGDSLQTLKIRVNGSGNVYTRDTDAKNVEATVTGSGDITLTAHESLDARISGSGNINYWGNPSIVTVNITGSGKVRKY